MDCQQLAVALGLEPISAKVEGVRLKAKRLAARDWLVEAVPGRGQCRGWARRRLVTMLIDQRIIASALSVRAHRHCVVSGGPGLNGDRLLASSADYL